MFGNQEGYELAPTSFLDDTYPFIYPLNITWRIPFSNYFYKDSGIFEYSHTPGHVLHHLRAGKGFVLIDNVNNWKNNLVKSFVARARRMANSEIAVPKEDFEEEDLDMDVEDEEGEEELPA